MNFIGRHCPLLSSKIIKKIDMFSTWRTTDIPALKVKRDSQTHSGTALRVLPEASWLALISWARPPLQNSQTCRLQFPGFSLPLHAFKRVSPHCCNWTYHSSLGENGLSPDWMTFRRTNIWWILWKLIFSRFKGKGDTMKNPPTSIFQRALASLAGEKRRSTGLRRGTLKSLIA